MGKSLAFVYGVPVGIFFGVIAGAVFEITHGPHSAAWGLLIGFGSGVLIGGILGFRAARGNYEWVTGSWTLPKAEDWEAFVISLNQTAAREHYLMVRNDADYLLYAPTLVRPVVAGPLTVSGEYLSVIVVRESATQVTVTGPRYMVRNLGFSEIDL